MRQIFPLLAGLVWLACGPADSGEESVGNLPVALSDQTDAVCGMLVREQSAPRGQVIHRDGSRFFFCSIGDLLAHLGAPSPHGRVESLFVETLEASEDPDQSHTGAHEWVAAEDAIYVVGIPRKGIMGEPVLVYADPNTADQVMQGHPSAQRLDLAGLRAWWDALQAAR